MKVLCELIKEATLDKALLIVDEAAGHGLEDIDSILQLAMVWINILSNKIMLA